MRSWCAAAVAALVLTGCGAGQDPGVEPGDGGGGARITSNTLPDCPPGGPDASTPVGCLDAEGNVVR
jgi:hypothetical protein